MRYLIFLYFREYLFNIVFTHLFFNDNIRYSCLLHPSYINGEYSCAFTCANLPTVVRTIPLAFRIHIRARAQTRALAFLNAYTEYIVHSVFNAEYSYTNAGALNSKWTFAKVEGSEEGEKLRDSSPARKGCPCPKNWNGLTIAAGGEITLRQGRALRRTAAWFLGPVILIPHYDARLVL